MTSMWAALGAEALGLFAITGAFTALVRNRLRKSAVATESE